MAKLSTPELFRQATQQACFTCRLPGGWVTQLTLCVFLFIWFLVFGVGFGMWASILNLVQNVNTYSAFAECYQCAGIVKTNALNG